MLDQKDHRVYLPIILDSASASLELKFCRKPDKGDVKELVRKVRDLVLAENLTPLQAQAVLVMAWVQIQAHGVLNAEVSNSHQTETE